MKSSPSYVGITVFQKTHELYMDPTMKNSHPGKPKQTPPTGSSTSLRTAFKSNWDPNAVQTSTVTQAGRCLPEGEGMRGQNTDELFGTACRSGVGSLNILPKTKILEAEMPRMEYEKHVLNHDFLGSMLVWKRCTTFLFHTWNKIAIPYFLNLFDA